MKTVKLLHVFLFSFVLFLGQKETIGIPINTVTPNLSTNWFFKPGPSESILFGLVVLKVLALRMAGVFPYNLNELLAEESFLTNQVRSLRRMARKHNRGRRSMIGQKLGADEFQILDRILLGLRRIDSDDCLVKHICELNRKKLEGRSSGSEDEMLEIFSIKDSPTSVPSLDLYKTALGGSESCTSQFPLCHLTSIDFTNKSILNGLF